MKTEKVKKPSLDLEIKAEVKGIQQLENNLLEVKEMALALQEFYTNTPFIEEGTELDFENEVQMNEIEEKRKTAKEEGTKVNTFKKSIEDKFKIAMEIYNKPIEESLKLKKETIEVLSDTYTILKTQVETVDVQLLAKKKEKFQKYFREMAIKETIDFINYDDMKQNVTLSATVKSLKQEIENFIKKIKDELELINTEEYKSEILVEYKKTLNVANAITTVKNRFKEVEEMKARELARQETLKQQQDQIKKVEEIVIKQEKVLEVPKVIEEVATEQKIEKVTLTIKNETVSRLEKVEEFLRNGGYDYE